MKPGPKTAPGTGALRARTVLLDDMTVTKASALGTSLSDGLRKGTRVAYDRYQSTADDLSNETALAALRAVCDRFGLVVRGEPADLVVVERGGSVIFSEECLP